VRADGQNNPEHRQTVVDVVCAYLRMPHTLSARNEPGAEQVETAPPPTTGTKHRIQRRDTTPPRSFRSADRSAQRILATHLQLPPGILSAAAQRRQPSPRQGFWPGRSLDLTGATLVGSTSSRCRSSPAIASAAPAVTHSVRVTRRPPAHRLTGWRGAERMFGEHVDKEDPAGPP
jgi:hypothetical protein